MIYDRRPSPLHAARAAAGCGFCAALAAVAAIYEHPLVQVAVLAAVLVAALGAGVQRQLLRTLRFGLPFAIVIALVNALVSHNGLTVIARLGELPAIGRVDVTLEGLVAGASIGLRSLALIACGALYSVAINPDEVLRLFRRASFRSALTATLATRMVPVLQRDSRRLVEAQRCRPGLPPSRLALVRAASAGALDRAVDVAAALELRGYGAARRPPRSRRPWSRQDLAFAGAAFALVAVALGGRIADLAPFAAYPSVHGQLDLASALLAVSVVAVAAAPFASRRGVGA
jgi:energy-coupling factor transport system permease protein